jgi:hypothetical protein
VYWGGWSESDGEKVAGALNFSMLLPRHSLSPAAACLLGDWPNKSPPAPLENNATPSPSAGLAASDAFVSRLSARQVPWEARVVGSEPPTRP